MSTWVMFNLYRVIWIYLEDLTKKGTTEKGQTDSNGLRVTLSVLNALQASK